MGRTPTPLITTTPLFKHCDPPVIRLLTSLHTPCVTQVDLASTIQITVTIQGANDAPVIAALEATPLAYTENSGPIAVSATLSLVDVDDANISSAVVQITGNFINGQDTLSFTNQNGITSTWNPTTGTLTLNGSASKADYETALRSITFTNNSEIPNTAIRTVSFTINDGDLSSTIATRDIAITSVNDAPLITIPAPKRFQ